MYNMMAKIILQRHAYEKASGILLVDLRQWGS